MSEPSFTDCTSDTDSLEEDIEPKLKYDRIRNDLLDILFKDAASCIAVHPKFICLGSHWGAIYILDHQGNLVKGMVELKMHAVAVNQISIDLSGDFIASCSDDGKVFIQGLYSQDSNQSLNLGRVVKTVALEPNYCKSSSGRRFITGCTKLTLYEKTFLGRVKATDLCESEGYVRSLTWGENFVAWASDIGVRVYDIAARCSLGLIKWEEHPGLSVENFQCNLRWGDSRTLLIGWVDTVRICVIRKRTSVELQNRDLPEYLVDPVSTFQTGFYISGIAPLEHNLVLLGFPKKLDDDNKSLRPQLYVVEYKDNDCTDICTDSLNVRGFKEYNVNDYHLDVLLEENRFFIIAPKDIVTASPYDLDDRIQWLMQHAKYEEALQVLTESNSRENRRFTIESVGSTYLDYLLGRHMYDMAGQLCAKIFGTNKQLWEDEIFKFATVRQLRSVSPYLPRSHDCILDKHIYEMVLYEYLKLDPTGFLELIREWNPELYNIRAVINAVLEHLLVSDVDKTIYLEAVALLYSYDKQYDKSLKTYLSLKNKDVFMLIQRHNLHHGIVGGIILELMCLDQDKAIQLFLDKDNRIPSEVVVKQLANDDRLLYKYLDAYDKYDTKKQYHGQLVRLYAQFDREKLLPLLKRSENYPIQEAFNICEKAKYYPEMVFLLARIGDTKEALELIVNQLQDMQYAITFCQEQNDADLWHDLINHAMDKPEYITFLLECIGTYMDPTVLVEKIPPTKKIPGLKNALVKMLCTYNLQAGVQEGCKKILVSDYFNLHSKLVRAQQRGVHVSNEMVCGACHRKILQKELLRHNSIIVYNCKHSFHEQCLPDNTETTHCGICHETKTSFHISNH